MGFTLIKRHAPLETYSKRDNKSKGAYQRRNKSGSVTQGDTELLRAAVLPTSPCNHKQLHSLATDPSTPLQRSRRVVKEADLSPSRSLSKSETPGDRLLGNSTLHSTTPQKLRVYPQVSRKRVSESCSQDSTCSRYRAGNNPTSSRSLGETKPSAASKKRGHISQTSSQGELPPIKRTKQSITNYFKPTPRSSSPPGLSSSHDSPDTFKSTPTPPSSPPSRCHKSYPRKYQKRRLTTKPCLPPITMMPDIQYGKFEEDEDTIDFKEAVGDMSDGSRVELAEQALDREEARDDILSASFHLPRSTYLAGVGSMPIPATRSRSNTTTANPPTASPDENDSTLASSKISTIEHVAAPETRSQPVLVPQRKESLTQMFFDLPQSGAWVYCKDCDIYYNPHHPNSKGKHDIQHKKRLGANVTKKEMSTAILKEWVSDGKRHCIVVIDSKQAAAVRSHGQAALGITSEALGSIHVEKEELWREISDPQSTGATRAQVPRFRIFVYYIDDETVSVVLAERIRVGCSYHPGRSIREDGGRLLGEPGAARESLLIDLHLHVKYPVWASIERVWTREDYRRTGYATKMVDIVRENFILGLPLAKHQLAFSCPFGSGLAFATNYCRGVFGDMPFLVNADEVIR